MVHTLLTISALAIISSVSSTHSLVPVLDNELAPQSMTTPEPSPMPTKRPSSSIEPLQWGQSTPSPTDAPNTVRRLQLWTCCKPEPTPETTEHRNSKLTHEPTEYPTPEPTAAVDSDFCGHGLTGCRYYKNDCEDICECDWDRGFETCADCSLSDATVCLSCKSGYTLSNGECSPSGAFTDDDGQREDGEGGIIGDMWMGIGIGFVFFAAMTVCMGMMVFLWRRKKAVVIVDDREDSIELTEFADQQLESVVNTTIELTESVDFHDPKPIN